MIAISLKNQPSNRHLRGVNLHRVQPMLATTQTPFMLLRTNVIKESFRRIQKAMPNIDLFYAVKANDHPSIIKTLIEENCNFDISSAHELETVIKCGGVVENAIHTNPIKMIPEFDSAVEMGVNTFVADNITELDKFRKYDGKAGVLVRIKTESNGSVVNLSYKFGAETKEIPQLLDRIIDLNIPFRGFCFHVGSQCTDIDQYTAAIKTSRKMINLAANKGLSTEILDIGGGFPIEYTEDIPPIEYIGQRISSALEANIDPSIRIISEPGRFICGEAVTLFSSVIGKSTRNGKKWYYIDDGLYGSFSGRLFDHCSYQIITNRNTKWEKAALAGPTCDSFDVIYDDCLMPPLEMGDILMFPAMGAYCSVSATKFNGLKPARIVTVDW
ncbi:MAG: type III PLP-dependent enzyme [candidate division Zixibacteria bacterium]|nr:type III PLP-dependent enzyme [candidate division Zixibacteria bacterium]